MTPQRLEMVAEARALVDAVRPEAARQGGACAYLTAASIVVAATRGIRLVPQAGSLHWRRLAREFDDGVESNHFAYVWTPGDARAAIAAGLLPECHVWAGDPVSQEIVDLSTRDLPVWCLRQGGLSWRAPMPPDALWCPASDVPDGAIYEPDRDATLTVWPVVEKLIGLMVARIRADAGSAKRSRARG